MKYMKKYNSPLGKITLVSDGKCLTGLVFDGQKYFDIEVPADAVVKSLPIFEKASRWLDLYFRGQEADFVPPIVMTGSDFRMEVWNILKNIPYGEVMTYGEIAKQVAKKRGITRMSAQAVGGAVGHNPISIIVPCHRVVGENGNLTGYAGGIDRKIKLLKIERAYKDSFYIPKKGTAL
ncbi:methylated-DNA--[protein]-cysteine S-methyltransferase [Clostridium sp. JNZ X4-2]|jgi:methylated-DNA-[protein]-cysteine S-methyltransferase